MREIKKLVRPPHYLTWFSLLLATGMGMAWVNRFPEAYALFAVWFVWSLMLWITSDYLYRARGRSEKLPAKRKQLSQEKITEIMHSKSRTYRITKWSGIAGIALLWTVCILVIARWNYSWELQQNFGVLTPADDPMPPVPSACSQPEPGSLRFYGGGGLVWTTKSKMILVEIRGTPLLSESIQNGHLEVSGDIYTSDGDLVHISKNSFQAASDLQFKPERPDRHTLRVLDKWHQEVLYIRYLNPHAIRVRGIFWSRGSRAPVVVSDKEVNLGGMHIVGSCGSNPEAAFVLGSPKVRSIARGK